MKRYTVKSAFSLTDKILILPGDEIYAELLLHTQYVYSSKTRKLLGKVGMTKFAEHTEEYKEPRKRASAKKP